jgi:hypothetical protein
MACARKLTYLLALLCLTLGTAMGAISGAPAPEERVEFLQTPRESYTNVVVLSKSQTTLFIRHVGGLATVKVRDLDKSTQLQLGYQLATEASPAAAGDGEFEGGLELPEPDLSFELDPRYEELWEKTVWEAQERLAALPPALVYTGWILAGLGFLFFSFCAHLVCRKAGLPATPLVWVPWLQLIPLARAAGLSWMWFLGALVPGVNLIGYCLWAFRIAAARGQGQWLGWLLLLPGVNAIAFLILAFADAPEAKARGPRKMVVLNQPPRRRAA